MVPVFDRYLHDPGKFKITENAESVPLKPSKTDATTGAEQTSYSFLWVMVGAKTASNVKVLGGSSASAFGF